jgi:hypothetical protein
MKNVVRGATAAEGRSTWVVTQKLIVVRTPHTAAFGIGLNATRTRPTPSSPGRYLLGSPWKAVSMVGRTELLFRIGVLAAIALTATVVALALEAYFDRVEVCALLGQGFAIIAAATFALWLLRRTNGRH